MYLDFPQPEVTDKDLAALGWTPIHGFTDLPPMGQPVLLRVLTEDKEPDCDNVFYHYETVSYYVGRLSRLIPVFQYTKAIPTDKSLSPFMGSFVKPEYYIHLPHGGAYCQNLQVSAWKELPARNDPCWKVLNDKNAETVPKVPIVIDIFVGKSGFEFPYFCTIQPMDVRLGSTLQEDEEGDTYWDDEKQQRVLLSTIYHPDGKDSETEYIPLYGDMTYYVPEFPETVLTHRILTK